MVEGLLAVIAIVLVFVLLRLGVIHKTIAQTRTEGLNELKEITFQLKLRK